MKKKKKATKWIIFARVLLVLQLIASAMIFAMAVKQKCYLQSILCLQPGVY